MELIFVDRFRAAHSTQKDAVRRRADFKTLFRQADAILVNGVPAHFHLGYYKLVVEFFRNPLQDCHGLGYNLRADAAAFNYCNVLGIPPFSNNKKRLRRPETSEADLTPWYHSDWRKKCTRSTQRPESDCFSL